MRKHCSDVCKLRPCLNKESKNSARLCIIVTAALQRLYSQTELIFWIYLVLIHMLLSVGALCLESACCLSVLPCNSCVAVWLTSVCPLGDFCPVCAFCCVQENHFKYILVQISQYKVL